MAEIVYALCALTSVACAAMLARGYRRGWSPLLFWAGACFGMLAVNNIILLVDLTMTPPDVDLRVLRALTALAGPLILLWGLIWEAT